MFRDWRSWRAISVGAGVTAAFVAVSIAGWFALFPVGVAFVAGMLGQLSIEQRLAESKDV